MILLPGAVWDGPIPNETPGGLHRPALGVILHITGSANASSARGWFHNPSAQASAHFIVDLDGTIYQEVSLDDKAWAEMAGNPYYYSIETVGVGGPLTNAQVVSCARIYAFCQHLDGFPFTLAETPGQKGFGWHGMGGVAWGNHPYCPGVDRRAQRPLILQLAQGASPAPVPVSPVLKEQREMHYVKRVVGQGGWKGYPEVTIFVKVGKFLAPILSWGDYLYQVNARIAAGENPYKIYEEHDAGDGIWGSVLLESASAA